MITIKDVAKAAGVSITTVSHALSGKRVVAEMTRNRILEVVQELGYVPSTAAQSLANNKTGIIGVVYPIPDLIDSEVVGTTFITLAKRLNDWDQSFLLVCKPFEDREHLMRLIRSRTVDGVILLDVHMEDYRIAYLRDHRIPFVLWGRCADNTGLDYVDMDSESGVLQTTRYLIEQGHTQIALHCVADITMGYTYRAVAGYKRGLAEARLPYDSRLVMFGPPRMTFGETIAETLFANQVGVTAVVTLSYMVGTGLVRALERKGLRVPDDVTIMSFAEESTRSACEQVVDLLMDRMGGRLTAPKQTLIQVAVEIRR